MAATITAKGTANNGKVAGATISVAVSGFAAGDAVVVGIACDSDGGNAIQIHLHDSGDADVRASTTSSDFMRGNADSVTIKLYSFLNLTASEASNLAKVALVPNGGGGTAYTMAVWQVAGLLATNAKDKSGNAIGTDSTRSADTTLNPTNAGDAAFALCGLEAHTDDAAGTWESDTANDVHDNSQRDGTTGSGSASNITLECAASVVDNNTTVVHAHDTGADSVDFAILVATYKMTTAAGGNRTADLVTAALKQLGQRTGDLVTTALRWTTSRTATPLTAALTFRLVRTLLLVTAVLTARPSRTLLQATAALRQLYRRTATAVTAVLGQRPAKTATGITSALRWAQARTATGVTAALKVLQGRTATALTAALRWTGSRLATAVTAVLSSAGIARTAQLVTVALNQQIRRTALLATVALRHISQRTATAVTTALGWLRSQSATGITAALGWARARTAGQVTATLSALTGRTATALTVALKWTAVRTAALVTATLASAGVVRTALLVTAALTGQVRRTAALATAALQSLGRRTLTLATAALSWVQSRTATALTAALGLLGLRTATAITTALAGQTSRLATLATVALRQTYRRTTQLTTAVLGQRGARTATSVTAALSGILRRTATSVTAVLSQLGVIGRTVSLATAALWQTLQRQATGLTAALIIRATRTAALTTATLRALGQRTGSLLTAALSARPARTIGLVTGALYQIAARTATAVTASLTLRPARLAQSVTAVLVGQFRRTATAVTAVLTLLGVVARTLASVTVALRLQASRTLADVMAALGLTGVTREAALATVVLGTRIGRPYEDVSTGNWTPRPLWEQVDEDGPGHYASILTGAYVQGDTYNPAWGQAPWDANTIAAFEGSAGKPMSIMHWGQAWYSGGSPQAFEPGTCDLARNHDSYSMINWNPWNGADPDADWQLADITAGTYDAYITQWATDVKTWGHPLFVRMMDEMNGSWYPWCVYDSHNGNAAADFVPAWRHIVDIFRAVGCTNAWFVWTVNEVGATTASLTGPPSLYPGDDYVDWVAADIYRWPAETRDLETAFRATYLEVRTLAPSKPFMLGEWGADSNVVVPSKASFFTTALAHEIPFHFPRLQAVVYFNWNVVGEGDWPIEHPAEAATAYAAALANSRYTGHVNPD